VGIKSSEKGKTEEILNMFVMMEKKMSVSRVGRHNNPEVSASSILDVVPSKLRSIKRIHSPHLMGVLVRFEGCLRKRLEYQPADEIIRVATMVLGNFG
jgi:hypothetical protein